MLVHIRRNGCDQAVLNCFLRANISVESFTSTLPQLSHSDSFRQYMSAYVNFAYRKAKRDERRQRCYFRERGVGNGAVLAMRVGL